MITRSKIASIVINFSSFNNSNVDFFGETHVDAILLGLQFTIQPIDLSKIFGHSIVHFREFGTCFRMRNSWSFCPGRFAQETFPYPEISVATKHYDRKIRK